MSYLQVNVNGYSLNKQLKKNNKNVSTLHVNTSDTDMSCSIANLFQENFIICRQTRPLAKIKPQTRVQR